MDEPICLGFAVLELSILELYENYYDRLHPFLGLENLQMQYMDCDSFVLCMRTQNIVNDLKNLEYLFDFSNVNENHKVFSNKKMSG